MFIRTKEIAQGTGFYWWIWKMHHFMSRKSPLQTVLEIHIQGGGLPVCSSSTLSVHDSTHFYKVYGRGQVPSETEGNACHELPWWLANISLVRARALCPQESAPYSFGAPWVQNQFSQELPFSQPVNCFAGDSSWFGQTWAWFALKQSLKIQRHHLK